MKTSTMLVAVAFALLPMSVFAQHDGQQFFTSKDIKWGATPSLPGAKFAVLQGPMNEAKQFTARIRRISTPGSST